jgi:hypothetical protein
MGIVWKSLRDGEDSQRHLARSRATTPSVRSCALTDAGLHGPHSVRVPSQQVGCILWKGKRAAVPGKRFHGTATSLVKAERKDVPYMKRGRQYVWLGKFPGCAGWGLGSASRAGLRRRLDQPGAYPEHWQPA